MKITTYNYFKANEIIPFGVRATSEVTNNAPLVLKRELNSLYNWCAVKFGELPFEWTNSERYKAGDYVYYKGKMYMALVDNSESNPEANPKIWQEVNLDKTDLNKLFLNKNSKDFIGIYLRNSRNTMKVGSDETSAITTTKDGIYPYDNGLSSDLGTSHLKFRNVFAKNGYFDSINADVGYIKNLKSDTFNTGTIRANTILGTSSSARYADLAEKYSSDKKYKPGTVLGINVDGDSEVTLFKKGLKLAGVVSTNPGFRLNDSEETKDLTFIALKGKVPVKVSSNVKKGDYLIPDENKPGFAKSSETYINGFVIGVALESGDKEVLVKI